jgi:hypothetical protein
MAAITAAYEAQIRDFADENSLSRRIERYGQIMPADFAPAAGQFLTANYELGLHAQRCGRLIAKC